MPVAMQAADRLCYVPWQNLKSELSTTVEELRRGYWGRHRRKAAASNAYEPQPDALEVGLLDYSA